MDLGLKDKVAIITGSSRGIGRSIALGLADEGCNVAICARGLEALEDTAAEITKRGVRVLPLAVDVTVASDIERLVNETVATFGRIDILVNNVGSSLREDTDEAWQISFETNVLAGARAIRQVVTHMQRQGSGVIINISSVFGREAIGFSQVYNSMKAAVIAQAKMLALQLAPYGIRVNSVAPGSVIFPGGSWWRREQENPEAMAEFVRQHIAMGRFGTPEEIANMVVFLASDRASWVTGACVNVDGGQTHSNI